MSAPDLDSLLEESLQFTAGLIRLEGELQRLLAAMDLPGLAAAVDAGADLLRRGDRLVERKRKLAGERALRELVAPQPEGAGCSPGAGGFGLLDEKLSLARAGQEVSRRLHEEGAPAIHRMQNLLSPDEITYNSRGEAGGTAAVIPTGLDQNC